MRRSDGAGAPVPRSQSVIRGERESRFYEEWHNLQGLRLRDPRSESGFGISGESLAPPRRGTPGRNAINEAFAATKLASGSAAYVLSRYRWR